MAGYSKLRTECIRLIGILYGVAHGGMPAAASPVAFGNGVDSVSYPPARWVGHKGRPQGSRNSYVPLKLLSLI